MDNVEDHGVPFNQLMKDQADYEAEFPNLNFSKNATATMYLNEVVEFGFQCWMRGAKTTRMFPGTPRGLPQCSGWEYYKDGRQVEVIGKRGPSEALASTMAFGSINCRPLYPHPPTIPNEQLLFDRMIELDKAGAHLITEEHELEIARLVWNVRAQYGRQAPNIPSLDEGMKLVMEYQYSHRASITGTTNWAADIARSLYDSVKMANGELPNEVV